jgi:hypothetical protein
MREYMRDIAICSHTVYRLPVNPSADGAVPVALAAVDGGKRWL